MSVEIIMPAMEMAQDAATLLEWFKQEGEMVNKGERLFSIETDKVTVEIEAPATGVLVNLRARAGDQVPVGQVIGELAAAQEQTIQSQPRDRAPVGQVIGELAAAQEQTIQSQARDQKLIGQVMRDAAAAQAQTIQPQASDTVSPRLRAATPKARRLAAQHSLALSDLNGSGPRGAVRVRDVEMFVQSQATVPPRDDRESKAPEKEPSRFQPTIQTPSPVSDNSEEGYKVVPLAGIRRTIATRLQGSYQTAPHIALTISADMSEIQRLIERLGSEIQEQSGHRLTVTAVLAKLVGTVLLQHPRLNAHLVGDEIREYPSVHMGIAVALDEGLIVPVVRNIERKGLGLVQTEIAELSAQARAGTLTPGQVRGSTFTISNLGMFEIEDFTAILNAPEVGILSVGTITDIPTSHQGDVLVRAMMRVTLNADHRAVDGAVAAKFLQALKHTLENPYLMFV